MRPRLLAYRGITYNNVIWLKGRLIQHNHLRKAKESDWFWHNFVNTKRRFFAKGIGNQKGRLKIQNFEIPFSTDQYGYFEIWSEDFKVEKPQKSYNCFWHFPELDFKTQTDQSVSTLHQESPIAIISDIDDTLVHTQVRHKKRTILKAIIGNAFRKQPIKGAALFCHRLIKNNANKPPIFYVSRSPFELYDLLQHFFDLHKFPKGPMLLRNISTTKHYHQKDYKTEQKFLAIKQIVELCKDMKFILVGDSSEKDALIYLSIADLFPDRISRIYIREVYASEKLAQLKEETQRFDRHPLLFFFKDFAEAENDAKRLGLIKF